VCKQFRPRRHRLSAERYRQTMGERFQQWREIESGADSLKEPPCWIWWSGRERAQPQGRLRGLPVQTISTELLVNTVDAVVGTLSAQPCPFSMLRTQIRDRCHTQP
jgi:hypothetical protein